VIFALLTVLFTAIMVIIAVISMGSSEKDRPPADAAPAAETAPAGNTTPDTAGQPE
jgi:hypothetical protein